VAEIGYGYGSECHLLRWMGRHQEQLNKAVLQALGTHKRLSWLDFKFDESKAWPDGELKGIDFLPKEPDSDGVRDAWGRYWPSSGNPPNWDAVGKLSSDAGADEWLLVEAKAYVAEFTQSRECGAGDASRTRIADALRKTIEAVGARPANGPDTWMETGHYQLANRLAFLHFMNRIPKTPKPARLLMVYFLKDEHRGWQCPSTAAEWRGVISKTYAEMGIPAEHGYKDRVRYLFLDVASAHFEIGL